MICRTLAAAALMWALAAPASALTVDVKEVRAASSTVHATLQLRDLIPDRFKKIVNGGGQVHLRLQAELWESRPVWDRLVYPAVIRMAAVLRTTPNPLDVSLNLGASDRIVPAERYYVHIVATIGTLAEREADDVNDAVFGVESDDNALGSFGRMLFRTALRVGDYLQSVSAEAKSRKLSGADIIRP